MELESVWFDNFKAATITENNDTRNYGTLFATNILSKSEPILRTSSSLKSKVGRCRLSAIHFNSLTRRASVYA